MFTGHLVFSNEFGISVEFSSNHNASDWVLTNVYGPYTATGKLQFINWLKNIQMPDDIDWLILGDFNLMRNSEDRNRPGGDINEMLLFNEAISALGIVELTLMGRKFTWTNKQASPLLERLDWFFTSNSWTTTYLGTVVTSMVMETSDHVPCLISVKTDLPKGNTYRFDNYLMEHEHFFEVVQHGWDLPTPHSDAAKIISRKFKNLRRVLRSWQKHLSSLKTNIANVKLTLSFLSLIEEFRDLSLAEWNFRKLFEDKLTSLLHLQKIYWKQRGTIRWVTDGDAGTKFFHANTTIRHKKKLITFLEDQNGVLQSSHQQKASIIWEAYKDRLGQSEFQEMQIDLDNLLLASIDLGCLEEPFTTEEIDDIVKNLPTDKSPGPDGFNTDFIKKCWPIIKQDFYNLCQAFFDGKICLQSINGSHITLIPKFEGAVKANDFRPISLLNTSMKLLTKLLANRLQKVIQALIHKNQYGFIQSRTIQDCVAWALEYIFLSQIQENTCHSKIGF